MMDLSLLPTFEVFADCMSLTETGRRLGLTQPAVHGQLKRLAESMDCLLYVRDGRDLVLTPRGLELAALARDIGARVRTFDGTVPASARLAAGRGAWTHVLPELLGAWIRDAGIVPLIADGPASEAAVREGRAELGVSTRPDPAEFHARPLRTVHTCIVAPSGCDPVQDRSDAGWILPTRDRPHRQVMEAWFRRNGLPLRVVAECNDWDVMVRWVEMGVGWAAVNSVIPTRGLPSVALADGPTVTYHLFWHPQRRPGVLDGLSA